MYRMLAALTLVGLLLVITTAANAASALRAPIAPRAPDQEHHVYLPLISYNYPPAPPLYRLYADPDDLDWLADQNPYQDETIPATFCAPPASGGVGGGCWDVDIRYRGDTARLMPKKCWKIFFPGSDLFQGQGELNLNADYVDQTLLRSYVGYDLFTRADVPAPRAGHARLYINDEYYGLFSQVEQVDERFLHRLGIEMHGNLYKPFYGNLGLEESDWWYWEHYPKKTNRQSGHEDLVAFIELINNTPDEQFPDAITEVLDVNGWLDWYAVNILIGNFEMTNKNHYLYHDSSTGRWMILPWDVDISFGHNEGNPYGLFDRDISWDNPIDTGADPTGKYNHLIDRMMDVPEFRFYHCRRLTELMADEFSPAEMFPRIDETFAYIYDAAIADPNRWRPDELYGTPGFEDGPDELKTYVTNRIQFLEGEMTTFCPDLEVPLTVNEFLADNTSTVADEAGDYDDWIEIHNGSGTLAWDLGGMYLTDDLSNPTRWQVPTGTLVSPGGTLLFWTDGEEGEGLLHTNFTLGAGGGQIGLFDRDVFGNAAISVLTYAAQTADTSYGRLPDGGETWQFFTAPTPGWLNRGHPPVISPAAHTPAWPTSSDTVTITAVITDEGTITAWLWYRAFAAGAEPPDYQSVTMTAAPGTGAGSLFTGTISAQTDGPWVEYYIEAQDEAGTEPPDYQSVTMAAAPGTGAGRRRSSTISAHTGGTWVEYYVEAQDEAGMVTVDRPGWPQGDYRYIVGWQRPPLYINELMALNTHTLEDGDGDHDDWIELYNAGPVDIDVGGMYLSDNIDQPDLEQLDQPHIYQLPPGTTVPAGGFLLLWADDDGTGDHLSFKLSGAGEYVGLFDSEASHYAPIDAVYFPPQTPDVSWGRFPDGSTGTTTSGNDAWHAMDIPTPGEPNLLLPPQFLEVTRTPLWPSAGQGVTVTAAITAGSPIVSATLWYDAGSGFQAVPMEWRLEIGDWRIENREWRIENREWRMESGGGDGEDRVYTAYIPPQPEGTLVNYYLEAVDGVGQTTLHPTAAPTVTHRYLVGYAPPALLINEFLANNESVNQDEAGEYDDWLELYNGSAVTVTLDGMYLTDHLDNPTKWQFPAGTTIPPGGYLLVWCDEDAGQGPLHAGFKLNREGEEIGLFAGETHGNVPLDTIVFGPQQEDISYGRQPDGSDTWYFLNPPTPGASNG